MLQLRVDTCTLLTKVRIATSERKRVNLLYYLSNNGLETYVKVRLKAWKEFI